MDTQTPPAVSAAPAQGERAARSAPPPALAYLGVLVLLGLVALIPAVIRPVTFGGLPDGAEGD